MAQVKICGLNSPDAFDAAIDAGADWVGFVFFPPSPRYVTATQAELLSRRGPDVSQGGPPRVGLFVKPTHEQVAAVIAAMRLDAVQLYDTVAHVAALRTRLNIPVWHAIGIADGGDLPAATTADRLLIEAKPPAGSDRPGGNATSFDWSLTRGWKAPVPWMLAGGLTHANVVDAIAASGATAVDVSSGVESAPGRKDPALIRRFVAAAHAV